MKFNELKEGDKISYSEIYTYKGRTQSLIESYAILKSDTNGEEIKASKEIVEGYMFSALEYDKDNIVYMNQSQMSLFFQKAITDGIFCVIFLKKPKPKDIVDSTVDCMENLEGSLKSILKKALDSNVDSSKLEQEWDKLVKTQIRASKKEVKSMAEGVERVLIGKKHYKQVTYEDVISKTGMMSFDNGMSDVDDLLVEDVKKRFRQVRHAGIKSVIYKGIKYVVGNKPKPKTPRVSKKVGE